MYSAVVCCGVASLSAVLSDAVTQALVCIAGRAEADGRGVLCQLAGHDAGDAGRAELRPPHRRHRHGCKDRSDRHRGCHADHDAGEYPVSPSLTHPSNSLSFVKKLLQSM